MSQLPTPTATAPARMKSAAVSAVTPPLGHERDVGERPMALAHERRAGHGRREELDRGRAGSPRGQHLGRGERAGERRDAAGGGPGDQLAGRCGA